MIRNCLKTTLVTSVMFPLNLFTDSDITKKATEAESKDDISVHGESGIDRVKKMFQTDEFGNLSKEVVTILNAAAMSSFVGAVYGGTLNSRTAYQDFIKNNQATAFKDHIDAKKKLQDKVTLSFGKGAFKWSWRLSLFCTSFIGISTTISVYRGKSGILDFVSAGLITGSLYKFNMGPRGWIVGGGLGAALGLIAGCTTLGILQLVGLSMDDVRYWQHHWKQERENKINKNIEAYVEKENEMLLHHDQKVGKGTTSLSNV